MKKNVWIFNHYAGTDYIDKGGRHYWIAKYLKQYGYEPVVFCCNKVHNTNKFCIENENTVNEAIDETTQVPYVFLKGRDYKGNGKARAMNMVDYYINLKKISGKYAKMHGNPDVIYASSVHPLALVAGIQLARKFNVKCVCEVRDLWPESIVSMGVAKKNNPLIKAMYILEKWIYKKCDALIMTFEGGYDYIEKMGYTGIVPKEKFYYINNGIDLDVFDQNVNENTFNDIDLDNDATFKVVYTGSLRLANGLGQLLGCAKELLGYNDIQFLVFGGGELADELKGEVKREGLSNVHMKGSVEKKFIPYVLSKGDVNMLNYNTAAAVALYAYGSSQNKLFEYLASGRPIISNTEIGYDNILKYQCGISKNMWDDKTYAEALLSLYKLSEDEYKRLCDNARKAAYDFDFKNHTKKLIHIFEKTISRG